MQKFKPGLKKGIAVIFEGARIPPEVLSRRFSSTLFTNPIGNLGPRPGADSAANTASNLGPRPLPPSRQLPLVRNPQKQQWTAPPPAPRKRSRIASIMKAFKEMPLRIFRPRSDRRREAQVKNLLT